MRILAKNDGMEARNGLVTGYCERCPGEVTDMEELATTSNGYDAIRNKNQRVLLSELDAT